MIKNLLLFTFIACAPLNAQITRLYPSSLDGVKLRDIKQISNKNTITPPDVKNVKTQNTAKEWTVMVFMNGKSNVEQFALNDFNKLEKAGSSENVNIVVEIGRSKGLDYDSEEDGDWSGVRRYYVNKDDNENKFNSQLLAELGDADMGDFRNAVKFVNWAKANYPAKRYMFILWDHGWGWMDPPKSWRTKNQTRSISHDFTTNNYIKTTELKKIFTAIGKIDVYASMACFMQMAEVATEIGSKADVIIGSEEVVQLASFDFEGIMKALNEKPLMTNEAVAKVFTKTFYDMYTTPEMQEFLKETKYAVQLSAVRGKKISQLNTLLKTWAALVLEQPDKAALKIAMEKAVRFEVGDEETDPAKNISPYADLYHFIDLTAENISEGNLASEIRALSGKIKTFIERELVIDNVYYGNERSGISFENTHGIAVTVPGIKAGSLMQHVNKYSDLSFDKATNWEELTDYLKTLQTK